MVQLKDKCLPRLVVRTSGFHPDNMGSIPVGDVNETLAITAKVFLFFQSTISTMMLIRTLRLRSGTLGESFAL